MVYHRIRYTVTPMFPCPPAAARSDRRTADLPRARERTRLEELVGGRGETNRRPCVRLCITQGHRQWGGERRGGGAGAGWGAKERKGT